MIQFLKASYVNQTTLFKLGFTALLFAPMALFLGIAVIDVVICLIGILFIIYSVIERDFAWLKEGWLKIFAVLWVYMMLRGIFTIDPLLSIFQSATFIRFAIFALALQYWLLKNASERKAFTIILSITLIFAAADGLLQLFTGTDGLGHHIAVNFSNSWRLTAISGKLNIGAKFSMIALPAIAYLFAYSNKAPNSAMGYVALILSFLFILFVPLTGERNASLMLFLGLALMFLCYKPFRVVRISLVLIFAGLALASLTYFSGGFKDRTWAAIETIHKIVVVDDSNKGSSTVNPYVSLLKTDWNIFIKNPIFGVGRKQYNLYCKQAPDSIATTKTEINMCDTNAQNIYLEWLDETGLVGSVLFFSIIVLWFRQFYLKRQLLLCNAVVFAAFIEICLRLWPLASTSSFFFSWCGGPFWLMVGWVFAYLSENKPQAI